ncbi:uncharacterized protein [Arachis hypogaea]|uniref:uncharacterized protein n=1 Tax=Arachis hypogaea TaxID=3818 RepID=UPI003B220236
MDKSWMLKPRTSKKYLDGLDEFLDFAFHNAAEGTQILCPCKNCNNCAWGNREDVYEHLVCDGFDKGHSKWIFHGECGSSKSAKKDGSEIRDNLDKLLEETFMMSRQFETSQFDDALDEDENEEEPDEETKKFYKLIHDAHQELYSGSKDFTKLSTIVRLLHIKNLHGWSNVSFNMLLQLLNELLPKGSCLPSTYEECKYKMKKVQSAKRKVSCKVTSRSIPAKILRYFPLKPRIKKLSISSKTADLMTWHNKGRKNDGKLRHPADSPAWKTFDSLHSDFALEPRNVRMGLASDGFNPYKTMSSRYSIWPVVLTIYNLPPWDCMKQHSMMLSLLIPGPSSPNRNIDIYLQPLIDELKELWENGFETYDAFSGKLFHVHAALLWTICDFPSYSMLSGWCTSGKL